MASLHPAPFFLGRKPRGTADSHWRRALGLPLDGREWYRQPPCGWPCHPPRKAIVKASPPSAHCSRSPFLCASSPTTRNRRKINPHRKRGMGVDLAYFHQIFLFCFVFWDQKHRTSQIKLSESQMWTHFK